MANSLKIYKTQLTPARNALVDDIEGYLYAIEHKPAYYTGTDALTYSSNDFQFTKPKLDLTIKINVDRDNNNLYDSLGNYVRIEQYQGQENIATPATRIWYYFIIGSEWTAQKTLTLTLSMDTINTFSSFIKDEDNWSDKTDIIRQHMPQYEQTYLGGTTVKLIEKIDKAGENITIPYHVKSEDINIEEPGAAPVKEWYLVYMTDNAALDDASVDKPSENPLSCYLYPKESLILDEINTGSKADFNKTFNSFITNSHTYGVIDTDASIVGSSIAYTFKQPSTSITDYQSSSFLLLGQSDTEVYIANNTSFVASVSPKIGDTINFSGKTYTSDAIEMAAVEVQGLNIPVARFVYSEDDYFWATKFNGAYHVWALADGWSSDLRHWEAVKSCFAFINVNSSAFQALSSGAAYTSNVKTNTAYVFHINYILPKILISPASTTYTFKDTINIYINSHPWRQNGVAPSLLAQCPVFYRNPNAGLTDEKLSCIDFIDRQDSKLVKIIAVPYCPVDMTFTTTATGYNLTFDPNVVSTEQETATGYTSYKRLKYNYIDKDFGKYLNNINIDLDWAPHIINYLQNGILPAKSIENEPKLKHSDFTQNKLVYADTSNTIRAEDIDINNNQVGSAANIKIWYQPTNTLSSDILYQFEVDNGEYLEYNNWDRSFISNRNNEIPIYNNSYINYIKYGYAAEKENMEALAKAERQANTINAITGIAGGGLALVGGVAAAATGNPLGALSAVSGALSLGSTIAKTMSNNTLLETRIANAQRSLASKVDTLKNQAVNVNSSGSSIDLLSKYTDNRLHYMKYEVPELLRNLVWEKFYYCGYSHLEQEKPRLNGRLLFNFIQCNPVFNDEGSWVYNYYLNDIKAKFNAGITYYHNVEDKIKTLDTEELIYDWKQQFENFEIDLTHRVGYQVDLNEVFSDNRFETVVQLFISNPLFINTGFQFEVQGKRTADSNWEAYKTLNISNSNVIYIKNDGTQPWLPVSLRFRVVNNNIGLVDNWTVITETLKPAYDIYNVPTITRDGITFLLYSEYIIGQDALYYQLRMKYNNLWQEYSYPTDVDYNNDYTTSSWFDIEDDLGREGKVISNCQAIYARVFNEATGRYSDWVAIEL